MRKNKITVFDGDAKLAGSEGGQRKLAVAMKDKSNVALTAKNVILAVGMGEERAVARKGQVVVRNMMSCTLAVDHRVVDGAMGAQYLQTLRAYIEQPAAMLV